MYNVTGEIINVFTSPKTDKYEEAHRIQLMGDFFMKDGQVRKEIVTLGVPLDVYKKFQSAIGNVVSLPVGFFVNNNKMVPYFAKYGDAFDGPVA